ncbi:unnamed protein product, partial [marine sediment metagenome]
WDIKLRGRTFKIIDMINQQNRYCISANVRTLTYYKAKELRKPTKKELNFYVAGLL